MLKRMGYNKFFLGDGYYKGVKMVEATEQLIKRIRPSEHNDVDVQMVGGSDDATEACLRAYKYEDVSVVALLRGKPVCYIGVRDMNEDLMGMMSGRIFIALHTLNAKDNKLLMKTASEVIRRLGKCGFYKLYNIKYAGSEVELKWLRALGFTEEPCENLAMDDTKLIYIERILI